ncbi:TPA: addiction module antitoxin [Escherichia coli]|uniref:addiction module antitoxin n=3 Tax=Enterobacteriaceae TaxID=543 RepID=UPI0018EF2218|nr:addiction module antitoxin [Escherichia coli]EIQ0794488.1 addiction module antitoxin [Escherichia coli]EIQ2014156.1 addiction module antitoxin [Escherichia coli]EJC3516701.1 addiction module antitoxin [Escherichia coli]EJF7529659.1 addiction module antitoxin [Escherichia coli]EJF7554217.1 addiction module antitoxin [Escherichia coli]
MKQQSTAFHAADAASKYANIRYTYYLSGTRIMHKRMTITLDEAVYEGLYRTVGKRRMSQFIEDLLRPHVVDSSLDDGYKAMAEDTERETLAMEWCNALAGDMADAAQ